MRPQPRTWPALALLSAAAIAYGCAPRADREVPERALGVSARLGNGSVTSYAELDHTDTPTAVGLVFSAAALAGPPAASSDGHQCFDADGDGAIATDECLFTHERVIPLPDRVARREDMPFKWVLLNWNPRGHVPPGIYDLPHFDVHFYIEPIENIFAIEPGPCGPERVRCDQFEIGKRPVPVNYVSPDFQDVDAVVPAMGNHLIDLSGPEFKGERFTRSWIFGAYAGRIIFYEEMVAQEYLLSRPDACSDIKSPQAVALSGYYPTRSCIRYDAATDEYLVSMGGFEYREASPPVADAGSLETAGGGAP